MIDWQPDTCSCLVEVNPANFTYVDWIQKCFLHKNFSNQILVDQISTHNQSFNNVYGALIIPQTDYINAEQQNKTIREYAIDNNLTSLIDTLDKQDLITSNKMAEKVRILALGPITKNQ